MLHWYDVQDKNEPHSRFETIIGIIIIITAILHIKQKGMSVDLNTHIALFCRFARWNVLIDFIAHRKVKIHHVSCDIQ